MGALNAMTDGFPPFFVVPAVFVVVVGIVIVVLIVRFFGRLVKGQAAAVEPERTDPSIASRTTRRNLGMS